MDRKIREEIAHFLDTRFADIHGVIWEAKTEKQRKPFYEAAEKIDALYAPTVKDPPITEKGGWSIQDREALNLINQILESSYGVWSSGGIYYPDNDSGSILVALKQLGWHINNHVSSTVKDLTVEPKNPHPQQKPTNISYERTEDGKWVYELPMPGEENRWNKFILPPHETLLMEATYQQGLVVGKAAGCKETEEAIFKELENYQVTVPRNGSKIIYNANFNAVKAKWLSPAKEMKK